MKIEVSGNLKKNINENYKENVILNSIANDDILLKRIHDVLNTLPDESKTGLEISGKDYWLLTKKIDDNLYKINIEKSCDLYGFYSNINNISKIEIIFATIGEQIIL
ncbi:hypothetical protein [Acetoanaerobium sticklandii]|uniref:hypothetical protein n=1 Tax=Acetoanaerobium sticklandii TaxID=1511 RepID=UPI003A90AA84